MKQHLYLAISLACLFANCVFAQEAPENKGWNGDLAFGFSKTSGNSDTTSISLTASAKRMIRDNLEWNNIGSYLYGKNAGEKSADLLGLGTRLNWNHTPRIFSFYELQYLRDPFKDFSYRFSPAGGLGYKLHSTPTSELAILGGFSGVFVRYDSTEETDSYGAFRFGDQFSWKVSETSEVKQLFDLTSDITEPDKFFIHFEASITAAVSERWALKLAFLDNYDNQPAIPTVEKNDLAFIAAVSLKY